MFETFELLYITLLDSICIVQIEASPLAFGTINC
jgi:hypothetical protein